MGWWPGWGGLGSGRWADLPCVNWSGGLGSPRGCLRGWWGGRHRGMRLGGKPCLPRSSWLRRLGPPGWRLGARCGVGHGAGGVGESGPGAMGLVDKRWWGGESGSWFCKCLKPVAVNEIGWACTRAPGPHPHPTKTFPSRLTALASSFSPATLVPIPLACSQLVLSSSPPGRPLQARALKVGNEWVSMLEASAAGAQRGQRW